MNYCYLPNIVLCNSALSVFHKTRSREGKERREAQTTGREAEGSQGKRLTEEHRVRIQDRNQDCGPSREPDAQTPAVLRGEILNLSSFSYSKAPFSLSLFFLYSCCLFFILLRIFKEKSRTGRNEAKVQSTGKNSLHGKDQVSHFRRLRHELPA